MVTRISTAPTFGIEEEFFLIDRRTGYPAALSPEAAETLTQITAGGVRTTTEWLTCQIEAASAVLTQGAEALHSLRSFRRALAPAAHDIHADAVALGTPPRIRAAPALITPGERYAQFADLAPALAAEQYINGMHVHVAVPDREAGVHALNGIGPWLPILTALGANSPLWRGCDSGFASWRAIHYSRWMASGVAPYFRDAEDYDRRIAALLEADAVIHPGALNWLARLPEHLPTIEVRACDVQLHADDAVTLALLIRALVSTALAQSRTPRTVPAEIPTELLDIAQWQAARFGMDGRLLDPTSGTFRPAEAAVRNLVAHVDPHFTTEHEAQFVHDGLERLLRTGIGAARQRTAFTAGGTGLVVSRAAASLTA